MNREARRHPEQAQPRYDEIGPWGGDEEKLRRHNRALLAYMRNGRGWRRRGALLLVCVSVAFMAIGFAISLMNGLR